MHQLKILEGTHVGGVQTEVLAWLKVLRQLLELVDELDNERRDEAKDLIHKAIASLGLCTGQRITPASRKLTTARRCLKAVLPAFKHRGSLIDSAFFIHVSSIALDQLITSAEELCAQGATKEEKRRLRQGLEATNNAFGAKLDEMLVDLEEDKTQPDSKKKKMKPPGTAKRKSKK